MFKTVFPLSLILALRFFGLFVVMPVLSLYALTLEGATPLMLGIVMGGYALSQMLLQVPFGLLSDKIGRKATIALGIVIFIIGSLICAQSDDIVTLLIGRLLQGAGAIGAVITAMISDLVDDEKRPKAMAVMGATISMSFALALVISSPIYSAYGGASLFVLTAILAAISLLVLLFGTPKSPDITHSFEEEETRWHHVLKDPALLRMDLTNFLQKGFMTMTFLVIPLSLTEGFGWVKEDLYQIYLPATLAGMLSLMPAVILAQKKGKFRTVLAAGIALFGLAYGAMSLGTEWLFVLGILLFFAGFNMHEPIMQALTSRYAKINQRGAALGVFNAFGYLGTFIGGIVAALLYDLGGMLWLGVLVVVLSIPWFWLIVNMPNPSHLCNLYLSHNDYHADRLRELSRLNGVIEWSKDDTGRLTIKYDEDRIVQAQILKFIQGENHQNATA